VLDVWPELHAVLAHMGGFRQWNAAPGRIAGRDVWLDTAYTLGHLPDEEFVELVRAHGVERVMFGTDGPWTDAAAEVAHLKSLPFKPAELRAILGGNAERFLAR
ncbi:MAG TPA: amidohydrolase family protein, partial [Coriobacteriia bacterium]